MHSAGTEYLSGSVIPYRGSAGRGYVQHRSYRSSGSGWRLPVTSIRGFVVAIILGATQVEAQAQAGPDVGRAPTLTIERYPESWSYLADPTRRTGRWTEPFKYIPLSTDGSTYLHTAGWL